MPPLSPARQHFERVKAQREASRGGSNAAPAQAGSMAERMEAQLRLHKAHLKTIQSVAAKIQIKREFLPEYAAYVDGVLAAGQSGADDVLTTVLLWRLDTGDWGGALDIAGHAVRHKLSMPDHIKRDVSTTLVEEIADAALARIKAGDDSVADLAGPLDSALELTAQADMPDEVRAKAYKALGLMHKERAPESAVEYLKTALQLDSGCGVKTEMTRIEKKLADSGT